MARHDTPTIAVTTDVVLLCMHTGQLHILLVQRKYPPFAGHWALPGGFVDVGETLATAAQRELYEETGVHDVAVVQIGAFGDPQRDPRRQVVSIAFVGLSPTLLPLRNSDETPQVAWFPLHQHPSPLAFDHAHIVAHALKHLSQACISSPVVLQLLPAVFTLEQIQHIYHCITDHVLDSHQFQRAIIATGAVEPTHTPHHYQRAVHTASAVFCMPWPMWCQ
ncbi:MAG: NUDIX domain-containing protein [Roseiflexaceae bacterium]